MAEKPSSEPAEQAAAQTSGGFKSWLPLLITLVAMPALAYGTMSFLILPKMKAAAGATAAVETGEADSTPSEGHGGSSAEGSSAERSNHGSATGGRKDRSTVRMEKIVVNVAGTMGTRFLMANITLVGAKSGFEKTVEENIDQLRDLANSTLSSKTIADLEKPGARNQIKTELIAVFNNALGGSLVKEVYLPEMAIQ